MVTQCMLGSPPTYPPSSGQPDPTACHTASLNDHLAQQRVWWNTSLRPTPPNTGSWLWHWRCSDVLGHSVGSMVASQHPCRARPLFQLSVHCERSAGSTRKVWLSAWKLSRSRCFLALSVRSSLARCFPRSAFSSLSRSACFLALTAFLSLSQAFSLSVVACGSAFSRVAAGSNVDPRMVRLVHGSLLDLHRLNLGTFDYIEYLHSAH